MSIIRVKIPPGYKEKLEALKEEMTVVTNGAVDNRLRALSAEAQLTDLAPLGDLCQSTADAFREIFPELPPSESIPSGSVRSATAGPRIRTQIYNLLRASVLVANRAHLFESVVDSVGSANSAKLAELSEALAESTLPRSLAEHVAHLEGSESEDDRPHNPPQTMSSATASTSSGSGALTRRGLAGPPTSVAGTGIAVAGTFIE